jgi:alpha-galactosidase
MGWNDWAHYQCGFTAQTILDNAHALVSTGLAKRGYDTVTIDDCWMLKDRDAKGDLQADPGRFPHGMKAVVDEVHSLGLKFGIYEDAGSETCAKFAGSGEPQGGGKDHFFQDARLFKSWGVDYLKLDGCNVYTKPGETKLQAYRRAYAKEAAALKAAGRPVVFSESAPAYFINSPEWYDVLGWVGEYGQLWREGTDVVIFRKTAPDTPRFRSVLWNYAYNLPLGRFQKPGNWNDADFIIGGDRGMSLAESRSQLALWSMMSAPLILSSDVSKLSPQAIAILGNKAVIAVDQDPLGRMAMLTKRSPKLDVLEKPLANGDLAVAALNRSEKAIQFEFKAWAPNSKCRVSAQNLWTGKREQSVSTLHAKIAPHDTTMWRVHPSSACGAPQLAGAIVMTVPGEHPRGIHEIQTYTRCLAAPGQVEECADTPAESWTVTENGELKSGGRCLALAKAQPAVERCTGGNAERWKYTRAGNLISAANGKCLTAKGSGSGSWLLSLESCGHNRLDQIWSLPNPLSR